MEHAADDVRVICAFVPQVDLFEPLLLHWGVLESLELEVVVIVARVLERLHAAWLRHLHLLDRREERQAPRVPVLLSAFPFEFAFGAAALLAEDDEDLRGTCQSNGTLASTRAVRVAVVDKRFAIDDDVRRVVAPRAEAVFAWHRWMENRRDEVRIVLALVAKIHLRQPLLLLGGFLEGCELQVVVEIACEFLCQYADGFGELRLVRLLEHGQVLGPVRLRAPFPLKPQTPCLLAIAEVDHHRDRLCFQIEFAIPDRTVVVPPVVNHHVSIENQIGRARGPQPEGVDSCSGRREFSGEDVGSLLSDVLQFNHRGGTLFGSARLERSPGEVVVKETSELPHEETATLGQLLRLVPESPRRLRVHRVERVAAMAHSTVADREVLRVALRVAHVGVIPRNLMLGSLRRAIILVAYDLVGRVLKRGRRWRCLVFAEDLVEVVARPPIFDPGFGLRPPAEARERLSRRRRVDAVRGLVGVIIALPAVGPERGQDRRDVAGRVRQVVILDLRRGHELLSVGDAVAPSDCARRRLPHHGAAGAIAERDRRAVPAHRVRPVAATFAAGARYCRVRDHPDIPPC